MEARRARWQVTAGVLACGLGLALCAAPGAASERPRPEVAEALEALNVLAQGTLRVRTSAATGLVSFLAAPEGGAIPVFDAPAPTPEARALAFARRHAPAFGLAPDSDLAVVRVSTADAVGMDHVRLQQHHRGVPVTGAEMTLHLRGEGVESVLAKTVPDLDDVEVVPKLTAGEATTAALREVEKATGRTVTSPRTVRLEVFNRGLLEGGLGVTRLAFFVEVADEGLREYVWVDARRGVVLLRFSQMPEARNRQVHSANRTPALPGVLVRAEGAPATGDTDTDTAYDFSGDAYDYFASRHGRDSFDGAGAPIVSTVHFCPEGGPCPFPNAAWTGTQLVYGDGFSRADDVVAHEYTHGVIERTANLFYYMQSGALNESIADIFGETVDLQNGRGNDAPAARWLIGEDVPGVGAIRNMIDPNQFGDPGRSGERQCLLSDNGGVHTNSGIPNHGFALMVDGGSYNGTVLPIGQPKASQIVYRALTHYLTSASNFSDYYNAMRQSCADLVGGASGVTLDDCARVERALDAVEMQSFLCVPFVAIPPTCPGTHVSIPVFQDSLEDVFSGNWTTGYGTGGNHWRGGVGAPDVYFNGFATSGQWSFWGFGYPLPGNSWVAMSRSVELPAQANFRFRHFFGFEDRQDGGLVQYSLDEGSSWSNVASFAGATPRDPLGGPGNPLGGRVGFTGQSWGYTTSQMNLSTLAGRRIRFRFHIGTGQGGGDLGWFIDDVQIHTCVEKPRVTFSDVTVPEGDEGFARAVFHVGLSKPFPLPVWLDYGTLRGTAGPGEDYLETSGRLTFPPGTTSRHVSVPVIADRFPDGWPVESFELRARGWWENVLSSNHGTATIVDDDSSGILVSDVVVSEPALGTTSATFKVVRYPSVPGDTTVTFQTADGSATAPADYVATSGTILIPDGQIEQTISVPVNASATTVSPRTFHVDLTNSSGPPITRPRGTATIYDRGFYPVAPCRVLDTRNAVHGPALSAGYTREVVVGSGCGIPVNASAVSLNVTVVSPTGPGDLRIFPSGSSMPLVSAVNYVAGQTRANSAVVALGAEGRITVFCEQATGDADLVIDVNGFFE
jgi:Zn-dependent metalloprotease